MEENRNNMLPPEEEEGLDIVGLLKQLWEGRKTVIICTAVCMALGLLAALTMQRTYTVSATMVPQLNSRSNNQLALLGSLAGFDLTSSSMNSTDISPLVYPQIVSSVPFRLDLLYTPLHYEKVDTMVNMYTYAKEYAKPTVFQVITKYTIGLPFLLLNSLKKEEPDYVVPSGSGEADKTPKPIFITKDEFKMIKAIGENVSLDVDKKDGYLTLTVRGIEPVQTAELGMRAQQLLQDEVTRFRTEKAQAQLDYVQARYNEIKAETESFQAAMATLQDRSQNMPTTRSRMELERIRSKYTVSSAIYTELAKQLEQAKMQVKRDTPMFSILQPITVPRKASNSRAKTLIVWTFFGGILGCGIVLGKNYLPKIKEMFADQSSSDEAASS